MTDYAYQDAGVEFLRSTPRALLGDEPGLGKTRQLLLAAESPALVVAPAMILDAGVWTDEHQRWRPDLDLTQVSYASLPAREKTEKGGTRPTRHLRPEFQGEWATVIFDEAHYLKGRETKWALAALKLDTERLWLATGTPIPNYAHELWGLLRFIYPGDRRFTSYWRWVNRWFTTWKPPWGGTQITGLLDCDKSCESQAQCVHWQEFHQRNLGDRFLQRLRDDVLDDLPPLTLQTLRLPLTSKQRRVYKDLREDYIAWVDGHEIAAWSDGGLHTKLARVCTGVELETGSSSGYVGSNKLRALQGLLEDRAGQSTLVLAHFTDTVRLCVEVAQSLGHETVVLTGKTSKEGRRHAVRSFQEGRATVLVGSLSVISEGLTLTRADTTILVERSWRPSTNVQAIRRVHRIGQERPVTAIVLESEDTIDERLTSVLEHKTDQQVKALRPAEFAALL